MITNKLKYHEIQSRQAQESYLWSCSYQHMCFHIKPKPAHWSTPLWSFVARVFFHYVMALLGRQTFQICKQADRWSWEQEKKWWDCGDTQQLTGTQVSWSCWTVHLLKCACWWSCILMLVKPCYLFLGLFLQWESHTREFRKCRFYSFIFLSLGCLEVCSTAYIFCLSFLFYQLWAHEC